MGEKRFTLMLPNAIINDTIVRKSYYLSEKDDVEKLVDKLNEQQDFIYQLQNLCGESDGENVKLRIENKKLKEENDKLIQKNCIPCELVNLQTREIDKLKEELNNLKRDETMLYHYYTLARYGGDGV